VRDLLEFKGFTEIRSGETWHANRPMGRRRRSPTPNTAFTPAGGWWEKWDEVCDQVFGRNTEVSEKNWADTLLETSQHTEDYVFLASSREIFIHQIN
jgi:hypothetical protein